MSLLLTFYLLFLVTYFAIIGFAVYRVFLFAKNKQFKGYSRRATLGFIIIIFFIVFTSMIVIQRYNWDDNATYWCEQAFSGPCPLSANTSINITTPNNISK